jgi:hypothetical protein
LMEGGCEGVVAAAAALWRSNDTRPPARPPSHSTNEPTKQPTPPSPPTSGTLTNKSVNGLHWSPAGRNIVLSGLKVGGGAGGLGGPGGRGGQGGGERELVLGVLPGERF